MSRSVSKFITKLCTSNHMSRIHYLNTGILEQQSLVNHSLGYRYFSNYGRMPNHNSQTRNFSVQSSVPPLPSKPPTSSIRWILGTLVAIILPFAGNKWGPFLVFKQDVDAVVETIEEIAEVVEKVAEVIDKVAENISGSLPDGGRIKRMVDVVEDMAEETAVDAQTVGNAIDKFQEVEEKVENIVDTLGDKANELPKEANV